MHGWPPWHIQVHCALQRRGAPRLVSAAATREQRRRLHGAGRGPGDFIKSNISCVIRKTIGMWEAAALHHADLIFSAYVLALPVEATCSQERSQHVSGRTMGIPLRAAASQDECSPVLPPNNSASASSWDYVYTRLQSSRLTGCPQDCCALRCLGGCTLYNESTTCQAICRPNDREMSVLQCRVYHFILHMSTYATRLSTPGLQQMCKKISRLFQEVYGASAPGAHDHDASRLPLKGIECFSRLAYRTMQAGSRRLPLHGHSLVLTENGEAVRMQWLPRVVSPPDGFY